MNGNYIVGGRASGLGNRIEEVIVCEALCDLKKINITYTWAKNGAPNRLYPILFKTDGLNTKISTKPLGISRKNNIRKGFYEQANQEIMLKASSKIKPTFNIKFENNIKPIGVHIRSTDRIANRGNKDQMTGEFFQKCFNHTIQLINELNPPYLFVASDDHSKKVNFISKLNNNITIVNPISDSKHPVYDDFFGLSLCEKIYMCSKFSSFAICASLIGDIPIVSYIDENETNLWRYYAKVELCKFKE